MSWGEGEKRGEREKELLDSCASPSVWLAQRSEIVRGYE